MRYAVAFALGVVVCFGALASIGNAENAAIAEKCDYAGKVKLNGHVYTCQRLATTQPKDAGEVE